MNFARVWTAWVGALLLISAAGCMNTKRTSSISIPATITFQGKSYTLYRVDDAMPQGFVLAYDIQEMHDREEFLFQVKDGKVISAKNLGKHSTLYVAQLAAVAHPQLVVFDAGCFTLFPGELTYSFADVTPDRSTLIDGQKAIEMFDNDVGQGVRIISFADNLPQLLEVTYTQWYGEISSKEGFADLYGDGTPVWCKIESRRATHILAGYAPYNINGGQFVMQPSKIVGKGPDFSDFKGVLKPAQTKAAARPRDPDSMIAYQDKAYKLYPVNEDLPEGFLLGYREAEDRREREDFLFRIKDGKAVNMRSLGSYNNFHVAQLTPLKTKQLAITLGGPLFAGELQNEFVSVTPSRSVIVDGKEQGMFRLTLGGPSLKIVDLNDDMPLLFDVGGGLGITGYAMFVEAKGGGSVGVTTVTHFSQGFVDLFGDGKPVWCHWGSRRLDDKFHGDQVADVDEVNQIVVDGYYQFDAKENRMVLVKANKKVAKLNSLSDLAGVLKNAETKPTRAK